DGSLSRLGLDLVTRWTFQLFPSVCREILGLLVEVCPGVVAEDEANAAIRVPVIEVLGLGEIGVAAQESAAKAAAETDAEGVVDLGSGAFVRGPIAGAVDQGQDLAGVGQGDDERMIAPGAIVGDVHAALAGAAGFDKSAVAIEDGFREELGRLPRPDLEADVVDGGEEIADVGFAEAAAEITGGGRIGNARRAPSVEGDGAVAAQVED